MPVPLRLRAARDFDIICRMKPVTKDNCDFPTLRQSGCIYVDKTAWLYRLATDPECRMFFLARPRRFGKSLMISTFKAMFEGRKNLFKGLDIMRMGWNWKKKFPVIHLNMGFCAAATFAEFERGLPRTVQLALEGAGVKYDCSESPSVNFGSAIDRLAAKGTPPVILIDEYDDPVACALKNPDDAERVRDALAPVYKQMKDRSGKIRFVMITGVSKFTKMSVFSALSSLVDISFDDEYAAMLGYTEEELDRYFSEHMEAHRKVLGLSAEAYRAEIRRLYNGYRFWKFNGENVYNPVSINLTMANRLKEFELYWAKTGKASFLMNFLKRDDVLAVDVNNLKSVSEAMFDVSDLRNIPVEGMLYQTGYLTIKDYKGGIFELGVPDEEVRQDLSALMSGLIADKDTTWASSLGGKLLSAQWDAFFDGLAACELAPPALERERHGPYWLACGTIGCGVFLAFDLRHGDIRRLVHLQFENVRAARMIGHDIRTPASVSNLLLNAEPLPNEQKLEAAGVGKLVNSPFFRAVDRACVEGGKAVEECVPLRRKKLSTECRCPCRVLVGNQPRH